MCSKVLSPKPRSSQGSKQILNFLFIVSLTAAVGVSWILLLHDYKAVDPFGHIFGLLTNSQQLQIPDFFVKSILQMYRHFPRCMSSGLCILFELEFILHSWKLPYFGKNIRVNVKDVLLSQWITLKLALVDRPLVGMDSFTSLPFIF